MCTNVQIFSTLKRSLNINRKFDEKIGKYIKLKHNLKYFSVHKLK